MSFSNVEVSLIHLPVKNDKIDILNILPFHQYGRDKLIIEDKLSAQDYLD